MPMCSMCGGPNKDMGLCSDCARRRESVKDCATYTAAHYNRNSSSLNELLTSKLFPILLGIIGVSAVLFIRYVVFAPVPGNFGDDGEYFVVSNGDGSTKLRYTYGERTSLSGNIYDGLVQSASVQEGGILLQLHYLSPSGYETFKRQFGDTKKCAASFYNANMLHTMVLARDPQCAKRLNGRTFATWEKFSISGKLLSFHDGTQNGRRIAMPHGPFNYILIDTCDQINSHSAVAVAGSTTTSW